MIFSPAARPIRVLRIATPADVVDAGQDPGVYRASRSPGRTTLLVEDIETGATSLVDLRHMAPFQPDGGAELAVRMNEILGAKGGG